MIKLDDNLLTELGLAALPAEEKRALLKQIYETLEMRVGTTLARQMTDAQLDEFEGFITRNDEQGALQWLEANFPNYKDVVAQEFETLKGEVRQASPQILSSVIQMSQQPMMQQQPFDPAYAQQQYQQPQQYGPQHMPPQQQYAQPMPPAQSYGPVAQPNYGTPPPQQDQYGQAV